MFVNKHFIYLKVRLSQNVKGVMMRNCVIVFYMKANIFLNFLNLYEPFNDQCSHHIETSQLICSASQLTGFYMMGTLVIKGLINVEGGNLKDIHFDEDLISNNRTP